MADMTNMEVDVAMARGALAAQREPRASAVCYDPSAKRIVITLTSGAELAVPIHLIEGLAGATESQIAEVEILGDGSGLHWEALDVDLTILGLAMGIFGTAKRMAELAGQTK